MASADATVFLLVVAIGWAYLTVNYLMPREDPHATDPPLEALLIVGVVGAGGVILALAGAWTAAGHARTGRPGAVARLGWLLAGMFASMLVWIVIWIFGTSS